MASQRVDIAPLETWPVPLQELPRMWTRDPEAASGGFFYGSDLSLPILLGGNS